MGIPETDLNFEHNIYKIKSILFNLFPGTNVNFNAEWLNNKVPDKTKKTGFVYGEYALAYSCAKGLHKQDVKQYQHYKIKGNNQKSQERLEKIINHIYRKSKALAHKWEEINAEDFKWFEFKNDAELAVAEELTKRNILFFCNAKCLITNRFNKHEKMSPDFLVIYQGKARILEIDGAEYHKNHFTDYRRDRLFERHGLRITRYTYDECIADSKRVVDEFLELFEDGINYFDQLIRRFHTTQNP